MADDNRESDTFGARNAVDPPPPDSAFSTPLEGRPATPDQDQQNHYGEDLGNGFTPVQPQLWGHMPQQGGPSGFGQFWLPQSGFYGQGPPPQVLYVAQPPPGHRPTGNTPQAYQYTTAPTTAYATGSQYTDSAGGTPSTNLEAVLLKCVDILAMRMGQMARGWKTPESYTVPPHLVWQWGSKRKAWEHAIWRHTIDEHYESVRKSGRLCPLSIIAFTCKTTQRQVLMVVNQLRRKEKWTGVCNRQEDYKPQDLLTHQGEGNEGSVPEALALEALDSLFDSRDPELLLNSAKEVVAALMGKELRCDLTSLNQDESDKEEYWLEIRGRLEVFEPIMYNVLRISRGAYIATQRPVDSAYPRIVSQGKDTNSMQAALLWWVRAIGLHNELEKQIKLCKATLKRDPDRQALKACAFEMLDTRIHVLRQAAQIGEEGKLKQQRPRHVDLKPTHQGDARAPTFSNQSSSPLVAVADERGGTAPHGTRPAKIKNRLSALGSGPSQPARTRGGVCFNFYRQIAADGSPSTCHSPSGSCHRNYSHELTEVQKLLCHDAIIALGVPALGAGDKDLYEETLAEIVKLNEERDPEYRFDPQALAKACDALADLARSLMVAKPSPPRVSDKDLHGEAAPEQTEAQKRGGVKIAKSGSLQQGGRQRKSQSSVSFASADPARLKNMLDHVARQAEQEEEGRQPSLCSDSDSDSEDN